MLEKIFLVIITNNKTIMASKHNIWKNIWEMYPTNTNVDDKQFLHRQVYKVMATTKLPKL